MFSNSGHHSNGVAPVVLEASEGGLSCCWVTEVQGGLTTSLRMVGHTGSELVHCHTTLTLEAFMSSVVTPVGVGGAWVVQILYTV